MIHMAVAGAGCAGSAIVSGAVSWRERKGGAISRPLLPLALLPLSLFKAAQVVLDSLSPLEPAHPLLPACSARSSSLRPSPEPRSHRVRPPLRPSQRRGSTTTTSYVAPCHLCTLSQRVGLPITRGCVRAETATSVAQPSALRRPFFLDARALTPGFPLRARAAVPSRQRRRYPWAPGRLQPVRLSPLARDSPLGRGARGFCQAFRVRSLERVLLDRLVPAS